MSKVSLKQQAVPIVLLLILLTAAVVSTAAHHQLKRERGMFSIEQYERLMHRVDVAIGSISDTMIEEGMTSDFEEMRQRAGSEQAGAALRSGPVEERVALDLTGVVWNPHMPLAFVNGLTVGKGDRVGDAEIIHIGKESISVRYPDKTERTLALTPDDE